MRLTAAEKREVIRLVEGSDLPVRHTLRELQVPRATFYTEEFLTARLIIADITLNDLNQHSHVAPLLSS